MNASTFSQIAFLGFFLLGCFPLYGETVTTYRVALQQSSINGSVHYSVLGKYTANFKQFKGTIVFDPSDLARSSVKLTIKIDSLHSVHPRLDRIVRSKSLLNTKEYPDAIFVSNSIQKRGEEFEVTGTLELRGVTRKVKFPFSLEGPFVDGKKHHLIKAKGKWLIRRKDFGISWNKIFDQGGIIVGDHVTIDWQITAVAK